MANQPESSISQSPSIPPNVNIDLSAPPDTPDTSEVLQRLITFTQNVTDITTEIFWKGAAYQRQAIKDAEGREVMGPKITNYLREKGLDRPRFTIQNGPTAAEHLRQLGFPQAADRLEAEGNFLLLFQLPKPLAQFWRKVSQRLPTTSADYTEVGHSAIAWGNICRSIPGSVWGEVRTSSLKMERVNPVGQHDNHHYYYLWQISPHPLEQISAQDIGNDSPEVLEFLRAVQTLTLEETSAKSQ